MATKALLTNEDFVRTTCGISQNLAGEYIEPSLREAQDTSLRIILGSELLDKVADLISDETIGDDENAAYKALLDDSPLQYYLAYVAGIGVCQRVTFKVANAGVVKTPDEKVAVAEQPDMAKSQAFFQSKADAYGDALARWLLDNRDTIEELNEMRCSRIRAHLTSSACSIFLGGPRGKRIIKY